MTVTFDAMHTVRANLAWLVTAKNAHYVAVVKANQPRLRARLARLPWTDIPTVEITRDHGHGRDETRTLKVATVGFLDFPHAAQAVRIIRSRWRRLKGRSSSRETVYDLGDHPAEVVSPALLAAYARRHWHVENKVHYVRDVSFGEDASTLRTGNIPANIATLRSAVINRLYRAGYRFVPPGRRDHTAPTAALDLLASTHQPSWWSR